MVNSTTANKVSQVRLDEQTYSKTMRLDILPSSEEFSSPPSTIRRDTHDDAHSFELTPTMLDHLYQHAYDAMLLTDLSGKVLSGNIRAIESLRCDSVVGLHMLDIISGADESLIGHLAETLRKERFMRLHAWCKRSSGEFFPAEIAAHLSKFEPTEFLCFFIHDITWRKKAEDRLQMADVAIRTTHAGVAVIDLEGQVAFANPAMNQLVGRPASEQIATRNLASFLKDAEMTSMILEAINRHGSWHGRVECLWPDGTVITADCAAAANHNSDGDLLGAVLSFSDMTDQIRAVEAERQNERNRVMMESIGTVCHHLGQPSTVLLNSIELMLRLKDDDISERRDLLELSLASAETLGQLLRELNDLRNYRSEPYLSHSHPEGDQIVALNQDGETINLTKIDGDMLIR